MADRRIRVLVADDHYIVREGLRLVIETDPGLELAGSAEDGGRAVELARELEPDVVLMDLRMPVLDGIEAIARLKAEAPRAACIALTTFDEGDLLVRALRAGARGCLLKDASGATILAAIAAVAAGGSVVPPDLLARLAEPHGGRRSPDGRDGLGERELEILRDAAEGLRSKEIAARRGIAERTVKAHLASAYAKLGADSRASAVAEAARRGLL